jgi:hypothetical protein
MVTELCWITITLFEIEFYEACVIFLMVVFWWHELLLWWTNQICSNLNNEDSYGRQECANQSLSLPSSILDSNSKFKPMHFCFYVLILNSFQVVCCVGLVLCFFQSLWNLLLCWLWKTSNLGASWLF